MFLAGCSQDLLSNSSNSSIQSEKPTNNVDKEETSEAESFSMLEKLPTELISFILIEHCCGVDQSRPRPGRGDPNICRLVCKLWYQLLKDEIRSAPTFTCNNAACNGDLELLRWARQQGAPWEVKTTDYAAKSGNLDLLRFLKSNRCPWSESVSTSAAMAATNRIALLDWLKSQYSANWLEHAAMEAAELGYKDVLMWIKDQGRWLEKIPCCSRAARGGHLELIKWLHEEQKAPIDSKMTWEAADKGHRHVLQWALEKNIPFGDLTIRFAAQSGDLDLLKWVKSMVPHLEFDRTILDYAVRGGNFDMLIWLVEEKDSGIRVNESACNVAARSGNLKILQWALAILGKGEEDDNFDDTQAACDAAANGHVHILDWLQRRKENKMGVSKHPEITIESLNGSNNARSPPFCFPVKVGAAAAKAGRIKTLKWLKSNDSCSFDESTFAAAALGGHVQVMRWLKEEAGCPWNGTAYSSAEKNKHKHAMKWLIENGAPQELKTQKTHIRDIRVFLEK